MPSRRRPRGHIRNLPSGSFQAIVYAGTDPLTGKERYLRETAVTYAGAEQALTRLQSQVDEDRHPKTAITVRQAITQWLDVAELEDTTRERYNDLIRLYILPPLGDMLASKLDAELLERFYARLHRCRALCTGRPPAGHICQPLSTSTTRKIHYIIRGALERAVRWQHLGVNKAAMAEAPSPNRTDPDPPSAEEAATLLNAAWADPEWGLLLWLTMITGSRRGEVSALRWRHIDSDRAILWVHRSNAQTKTGIKEKETKTGQRRKVALDPHTLGLLNHHRELWERHCSDLGCVADPDAFVFSPAPDGSAPHAPRAISQRYRRSPQAAWANGSLSMVPHGPRRSSRHTSGPPGSPRPGQHRAVTGAGDLSEHPGTGQVPVQDPFGNPALRHRPRAHGAASRGPPHGGVRSVTFHDGVVATSPVGFPTPGKSPTRNCPGPWDGRRLAPRRSRGRQAATSTVRPRLVDGGTGSPASCRPSMWKAIASRISAAHSSMLSPVAATPGRSGQ